MKIAITAISSFVLSAFMSLSVMAAPTTVKNQPPLGIDISYPQCGTKVPTNHAFGIVGINGGLATEPNACLSSQLQWAAKAVGGTKQETIQLYVNTANPGGLGTKSWPQDNFEASGNFVINQYGLCNGDDTLPCAWQYGWNRAYDDVNVWFPGAAQRAGINTNAAAYIWWLDVEIENTWKLEKTDFAHASNVAVLEGMASYFASQNIRTGLYSTGYQWSEITGNKISDSSKLNGLPNWRPGGKSLTTAQQACSATPLTKDGAVVLAQYISRGLDYNYSCVQ